MTAPTAPMVYVAGPLFDEGERWWIEKVEQTVAAAGFATFLPHRDNPPKDGSCAVSVGGFRLRLDRGGLGRVRRGRAWRERSVRRVSGTRTRCG